MDRNRLGKWGLALAGMAMWGVAQGACLSDAQVEAWASSYAARTPAANPPEDLSDADGACTRSKFTAALDRRLGKVIGYKAGLTNPAVQQRFKTDKPVWGKLYEGMILESGAAVPADFGARPLFEADMLVRVRSGAIGAAGTPEQVLQAIDQIVPFIELPDLMVQAPPQLNGAGVAAINVGARLGVAGPPLEVPADEARHAALLQALADMQATLTDGDGKELARGKGSDVLGHPLNAVVWLVQALAQDGIALQPGDWVSLGSFSPLMPPAAGQEVTLRFEGLEGAQPVTVRFE